ncbi:hypothetical protein ACIA5G_39515 [Amycolatopsis sp. NPDC051758]|uniref:hypothetical protein n=1 Tax=Amycolatopsis sp. NPDC051758 TaxID=3363935 RepID=UPI00378EE5DB
MPEVDHHKNPAGGEPEWAWILQHPTVFEDDGRITFVRSADVAAIFDAFGLDAAQATPQSLTDCWSPDGAAYDGRTCLRVATSGDWSAAIEPVRASTMPDTGASTLSFDNDVVVATMNLMGQGWISHIARGRLQFGLEVGQAYDGLAGEATARFERPMREAGLIDRETPRDARTEFTAALAVLAREFGFSFSAEQIRGPLPTVYYPT